jgi:hypothetical protein
MLKFLHGPSAFDILVLRSVALLFHVEQGTRATVKRLRINFGKKNLVSHVCLKVVVDGGRDPHHARHEMAPSSLPVQSRCYSSASDIYVTITAQGMAILRK